MNPIVIQKYKEANDIGPCYEGIAGLARFEDLLKTIGYDHDGMERAIINFLEDNSEAIQALEDWIGEQDNQDWEDALVSETPYQPGLDYGEEVEVESSEINDKNYSD